MTKYVAIGAVILILAAAVYAFMSYSPGNASEDASVHSTEKTQTQEEDTAKNQAVGGAFTGTMADLAARGGSWQCAVQSSNQFADSEGTVYVSGERLRGNFTSAISVQGFNQTVGSHMIQEGGYAYVWTSLSSQGFKMSTSGNGNDSSAGTSGQAVDLNQQYSYDCEPWAVDARVFVLPQGVTFAE
jgi:hypothetical protein